MNNFQWTIDALTLYGRRFDLVPPCGELPRQVHLRQWSPSDDIPREVSDETRAKLTAAREQGIKVTTASFQTAQKYLPQINELMATGLNQKETAARLGIHPVAVSRMLTMYPNGI